MASKILALGLISLLGIKLCAADQCEANAQCPDNLCCSKWGFCGSTSEYCGDGCQSQCGGNAGGGDGGTGGGGSGGGGPPANSGESTGIASFYGERFPTACFGFDENQYPQDDFYAAGGDGDHNIWNDKQNCGKYFRIRCTGEHCRTPDPIFIKITDRCPEGYVGGRAFDLSIKAFNHLADPDVGIFTVVYSGPFDNPW